MMKHRIEVTLNNIQNGTPGDTLGCPLSLAISEVIPEKKVHVFGTVAMIGGVIHPIPLECVEFQRKFDKGLPVSPFTFTLDTSRVEEGWKWS